MKQMPSYTNIYLPDHGSFHKYKGVWSMHDAPIDIDFNGTIKEVMNRLTEASIVFTEGEDAQITVTTSCDEYWCEGGDCGIDSHVSGTRIVTDEIVKLIEEEVARQKQKYKADAPKRAAATEKQRKANEKRRQKEVADFIKYHPELVIVPKDQPDED